MSEFVESPTYRRRSNIRVITITLLVIGLIALIAWLIIWRGSGTKVFRAGISKSSISLGESVFYHDSSDFAKKWYWNFGDEEISNESEGMHFYKNAGEYIIKLKINNKDTINFFISVKDTVTSPRSKVVADSPLTIIAPATAFVDDRIRFEVVGVGNNTCIWYFGDEGDMPHNIPPITFYKYNEAKAYQVYVYSEDKKRHGEHIINIVDRPDTSKIPEIDGNDFREHLQQIVYHADYNFHYYYLMDKYLCNHDDAIMKVNNDKTYSFYRYCRELSLSPHTLVQSAILTRKEKCVISVEIAQTEMH